MKRGASLAFALTFGLTSLRPFAAFADEPPAPPPPPSAPAPSAPAPSAPAPAEAPPPPPSASSPAPASASGSASTEAETPSFSVAAETTPSSNSTEKVIGFSVLGVGVISLIIGAVEGVRWHSNQSDADSANASLAATSSIHYPDSCAVQNNPAAAAACQKNSDAGDARQAMYVFLGAGGLLTLVGAGILVNAYVEHKDNKADQKAARVRVIPAAGPQGGGLNLHVTF
jgi:hypothetical protein